MRFNNDLLVPALIGLGIYAQNSEMNLANNTSILFILFLLLNKPDERHCDDCGCHPNSCRCRRCGNHHHRGISPFGVDDGHCDDCGDHHGRRSRI